MKAYKSKLKEVVDVEQEDWESEDSEVSSVRGLMDEFGIHSEDGLGVLFQYEKAYGKHMKNRADVIQLLQDFKSDVEDYAMPAVDEML